MVLQHVEGPGETQLMEPLRTSGFSQKLSHHETQEGVEMQPTGHPGSPLGLYPQLIPAKKN